MNTTEGRQSGKYPAVRGPSIEIELQHLLRCPNAHIGEIHRVVLDIRRRHRDGFAASISHDQCLAFGVGLPTNLLADGTHDGLGASLLDLVDHGEGTFEGWADIVLLEVSGLA